MDEGKAAGRHIKDNNLFTASCDSLPSTVLQLKTHLTSINLVAKIINIGQAECGILAPRAHLLLCIGGLVGFHVCVSKRGR